MYETNEKIKCVYLHTGSVLIKLIKIVEDSNSKVKSRTQFKRNSFQLYHRSLYVWCFTNKYPLSLELDDANLKKDDKIIIGKAC